MWFQYLMVADSWLCSDNNQIQEFVLNIEFVSCFHGCFGAIGCHRCHHLHIVLSCQHCPVFWLYYKCSFFIVLYIFHVILFIWHMIIIRLWYHLPKHWRTWPRCKDTIVVRFVAQQCIFFSTKHSMNMKITDKHCISLSFGVLVLAVCPNLGINPFIETVGKQCIHRHSKIYL